MPRKPSPPLKKLVILEDSVLASMANNRIYTEAFPFLKVLQQLSSAPSCGSCGKSGNNDQRSATLTQVKQTIASMGDQQKRRMMQMLNAEQIRLMYKQGAKIISHTFS